MYKFVEFIGLEKQNKGEDFDVYPIGNKPLYVNPENIVCVIANDENSTYIRVRGGLNNCEHYLVQGSYRQIKAKIELAFY